MSIINYLGKEETLRDLLLEVMALFIILMIIMVRLHEYGELINMKNMGEELQFFLV